MAKLRSGILGNIRGKVAGVVGGQFKDVNYLREYVKPANPNTAAQQTQRTKMSDAVAFCKPLVGPVFNAYTDKFQKSMSGFNYFIKQNIARFNGAPNYSTVQITEGKLSPIIISSAVVYYDTETLAVNYSQNLGNNGSAGDKIFAAAYYAPTGVWYFASAEADRDDETIEITIPAGLTETSFHVYAWPIKYSGTLVDIIGNSDYATGEAA